MKPIIILALPAEITSKLFEQYFFSFQNLSLQNHITVL